MPGKVHRDLKLENILLSKKEDEIENISIKVLHVYFYLPVIILPFLGKYRSKLL